MLLGSIDSFSFCYVFILCTVCLYSLCVHNRAGSGKDLLTWSWEVCLVCSILVWGVASVEPWHIRKSATHCLLLYVLTRASNSYLSFSSPFHKLSTSGQASSCLSSFLPSAPSFSMGGKLPDGQTQRRGACSCLVFLHHHSWGDHTFWAAPPLWILQRWIWVTQCCLQAGGLVFCICC